MVATWAGVRMGHLIFRVVFTATTVPTIFPEVVRPVLLDQIFSRFTVTPSRAGSGIFVPLIYRSLTVIFANAFASHQM